MKQQQWAGEGSQVYIEDSSGRIDGPGEMFGWRMNGRQKNLG